jgi:hypothetical protein
LLIIAIINFNYVLCGRFRSRVCVLFVLFVTTEKLFDEQQMLWKWNKT